MWGRRTWVEDRFGCGLASEQRASLSRTCTSGCGTSMFRDELWHVPQTNVRSWLHVDVLEEHTSCGLATREKNQKIASRGAAVVVRSLETLLVFSENATRVVGVLRRSHFHCSSTTVQ